ncbi:ArsR family transcriptional regulator [Rhizobium sp. Leaf371]|uniref:ArsR/SmtB family transcription factor n=1 Tax=unclassified Rhizobium TaxID=2613769 RepID=UPI00071601D3|nr:MULTISPECIES: helix-turn-helix domain-containing protein [unclassified Rhizobium]KQS63438.1 ArsR family transcriptional regulator [Rhizobium sp. Leaf371]TCM57575.1 ArsR family transcriptional regulator [Rhizobium sp. PP-F2F-G48]
MAQFFHPSTDDITLSGVLAALGEPARLRIVRALATCPEGRNCGEAAPDLQLPRSTLSNHFRILRESGLVRMQKKGVENINALRFDDIELRFPGLLTGILSYENTD